MRITRRQGLQGLAAGAATVAMPAIVSGQEKEIVIGAPNSLTGGLGEVGSRGTWGMQIAVDQINREGGIKSHGRRQAEARDRRHDVGKSDPGGEHHAPHDRSGRRDQSSSAPAPAP